MNRWLIIGLILWGIVMMFLFSGCCETKYVKEFPSIECLSAYCSEGNLWLECFSPGGNWRQEAPNYPEYKTDIETCRRLWLEGKK